MSEPIKKATLSDPTHQIPFKTKSPGVEGVDASFMIHSEKGPTTSVRCGKRWLVRVSSAA